MILRPLTASLVLLQLLHVSYACIPMVPGEETTTTMMPTTTEEPTTTTEEIPTTTPDPCTTCVDPPPFTCDLVGYDCAAATSVFTITIGDCAELTCPDDNLLADSVPVTSLTCNSNMAWYYLDDMQVETMASTALCVSPCTACVVAPIPPEVDFPPPKGSLYEPTAIDTTTVPCPSATCAVGTLIGVRECEKTLAAALTCNGKAEWVSGGLVYPYAACKIPCDNCAAPVGYSDYPTTVSAHQLIVFNNYQFACAQVRANCPAGYALRITKADGTDEIIAQEHVASIAWSCRNAVWTIKYTDNNNVMQTADVTNSECYTGTCISCSPPMLVIGVTATIGFNMASGCKYYELTGCPAGTEYRANGMSFGAGVTRIRCANVAATNARAGWYGAGSLPVRWFQPIDAIGCA